MAERRPLWQGQLKLSLVSCEVKLFPVLTHREEIHFNLLNPETGNRIRMQPTDAETGEELERADLVKGYQYSKDRYVVVTDEELNELKIESSDVMAIEKFVPAADIAPIFYDQSYYVVPAGKADDEAFGVIREAMKKAGKVALARVVISRRERIVAVESQGKGMVGHSLHEAEDISDMSDVLRGAGGKPEADMVAIAAKLVEQKSGDFDPKDFKNRYEDRLRELIDAKLAGEKLPEEPEEEDRSNVVDLMTALKQSLSGKGKGKEAAGDKKSATIHHLPSRKKSAPKRKTAAKSPAKRRKRG